MYSPRYYISALFAIMIVVVVWNLVLVLLERPGVSLISSIVMTIVMLVIIAFSAGILRRR